MMLVTMYKCVCLLLTVHFHHVLSFYTYYMMERCPKNLLKMADHGIWAGRLRLTQENALYRKDMLCLMSVVAPEDHQLVIHFLSIEIEGFVSDGCETDYLMMFDGPDDKSPAINIATNVVQYTKTPDKHRLCGTLTPRASFVTTGTTITFKFFTDNSHQFRGFDLIFTAFHTGRCYDGEFTCKNGRCINATLQCNDFNNCGDDSDWCGPNNSLVIFVVVICLSIFVLLVTSVFRCSCKERVKRFTKSTNSGPEDDLAAEGSDIRVASFRGFPRQESTSSQESVSEPQQEPLLHDSTSSV